MVFSGQEPIKTINTVAVRGQRVGFFSSALGIFGSGVSWSTNRLRRLTQWTKKIHLFEPLAVTLRPSFPTSGSFQVVLLNRQN